MKDKIKLAVLGAAALAASSTATLAGGFRASEWRLDRSGS